MILKGFKRNALKKNLETLLKKRSAQGEYITELKNLAVLIDASKSADMKSVLKLANDLGVSKGSLKIMGYKEDQKDIEEDQNAGYYNDKCFGMNGVIKSTALKEFVNKEYDVLINFYSEDKLELNYIATASKAKFKVGLAEIDNRINDLVIGKAINDVNLFVSELKKYLKILQFI